MVHKSRQFVRHAAFAALALIPSHFTSAAPQVQVPPLKGPFTLVYDLRYDSKYPKAEFIKQRTEEIKYWKEQNDLRPQDKAKNDAEIAKYQKQIASYSGVDKQHAQITISNSGDRLYYQYHVIEGNAPDESWALYDGTNYWFASPRTREARLVDKDGVTAFRGLPIVAGGFSSIPFYDSVAASKSTPSVSTANGNVWIGPNLAGSTLLPGTITYANASGQAVVQTASFQLNNSDFQGSWKFSKPVQFAGTVIPGEIDFNRTRNAENSDTAHWHLIRSEAKSLPESRFDISAALEPNDHIDAKGVSFNYDPSAGPMMTQIDKAVMRAKHKASIGTPANNQNIPIGIVIIVTGVMAFLAGKRRQKSLQS